MIKDVEKSKANIFPQQGKKNLHHHKSQQFDSRNVEAGFQFTAEVDEDYMVIGGHIDDALSAKIKKGEYIDFGKLLPRDRIVVEEDSCMELVMKNGKAFWIRCCWRDCYY